MVKQIHTNNKVTDMINLRAIHTPNKAQIPMPSKHRQHHNNHTEEGNNKGDMRIDTVGNKVVEVVAMVSNEKYIVC